MRILIVDGSRDQRLHLVQALVAVTNVVIQGAVPDMRSALEAVVGTSPDVIVTGAALPDGDGTQLIESVRRLARTPSFVVVAETQSDELRARYLAVGVDRYVETPVDERALQLAVTTLRRRPAGSVPPEETQRLLGRMTSGVVHDLNNYIHVLDVTLTLLRRHPEDEQLWAQSRAAVHAMSRLNSTLLAYARGAAVAPSLVDIGQIARETIATLGRVVPPEVLVRFDIGEKLPPVHGVRSELEQLVLNLVINACDAMPSGGELTIAVRRTAGSILVLEVTDTGDGIAPGSISGGSTKRSGAGLGLAIVQAVVDRHRGAMNIAPVAEGRGTKVVVMLPTARSAPRGSTP